MHDSIQVHDTLYNYDACRIYLEAWKAGNKVSTLPSTGGKMCNVLNFQNLLSDMSNGYNGSYIKF